MNKVALYCLCFFLLLTGTTAYAQQGLLSGKVVDEHDKPIAGAIVKIMKQGRLLMETRSGDDGLYYTKLLDQGSYNVDIVADGKYLKAKKVCFNAAPGVKQYYILKALEDKVEVTIVDEEDFNESNLRDRRDVVKQRRG